jgi:hypothetical protein
VPFWRFVVPDSPVSVGPFIGRKAEPEDRVRTIVTLLFSFALVLFLCLYLYEAVSITDDRLWGRAKEAFGVILPALTGTLGTVIGFYFGNRKNS